jgi:hypothetical protein
MICTGTVVKEYVVFVPKGIKEEDIEYACEEIAKVLEQMATIKAMMEAKNNA